MRTVTVRRSFAAAPEQVFDWISNSSNYPKQFGVLAEKRVRDGEGAPYGVGAQREIICAIGWYREDVTVYEPPTRFGYHIVQSVPAVDHRSGLLTITPTQAGSALVWTTTFAVPLPVGSAVAELAFEPAVKLAFTLLLAAAAKDLAASC